MNKELIKELEACGFVIGSLDILSKKLDDKYLCEYRVPTKELWISENKSVLFTKMHQTFAQIAEKVLELTGVTLTPKPTKAVNEKLIKELKGFGFRTNTKESLRLVFEGMRFMYCNNRVDVLTAGPNGKYVETVKVFNVDQIQEVVMEHTAKYLTPKQTKRQEIDTLRESVKMLDKENHEMGVYIAKNEKENQELGKRIDVLEKDKAIKELEGLRHLIDTGQATPNTTKAEPKSEPEKTEGVFKMGDPVETFYSVGKAGQRVLIVSQSDLDNEPLCTTKAPKEAAKVLEFGDMLESLVDFDGVKVGQKVVFLSKSVKKYKEDVPEGLRECHVIDEWTNHYSMTADSFKGFEPKEKVLEFGGWAETLVQIGNIGIGQRILIVGAKDQDGEWQCRTGHHGDDYANYIAEDLKAL